jgi:AraC-like DNA-binding protein
MSHLEFSSTLRTVTTMTPLQYQKWLRLHKARQLMWQSGWMPPAHPFEVGYRERFAIQAANTAASLVRRPCALSTTFYRHRKQLLFIKEAS